MDKVFILMLMVAATTANGKMIRKMVWEFIIIIMVIPMMASG